MIPSLIAALLPGVPSLIDGAEQLFAAIKQSGPQKMTAVAQALRGMIGAMIENKAPLADGTVPTQPDQAALEAFIESVFQQRKASPDAAPEALYLVRGAIQQLQLAVTK